MTKNGEISSTRDALAGERLVDQQGQADTEDQRDQDHAADQDQRVPHGGPEVGVGVEVLEVLKACEGPVTRLHQVVGDEREVQGHQQWHDHPEEERGHRRGHQGPWQQSFHGRLSWW
jgi:hypothetical protein